jgi:hypothetical protein
MKMTITLRTGGMIGRETEVQFVAAVVVVLLLLLKITRSPPITSVESG